MNEEKIPVTSGGVNIFAYGEGAHVAATFTTATEEEGRRLKEAIEKLVEEKK